jgi:hypothetical protein
MGEAGERWPSIVTERGGRIIVDQPLTPADLKPYVVKNYEAQQTSLYYSLVAPLAPIRSALFELRVWRAMSLFFALIAVLATAEVGRRWLGPIGILGGAILFRYRLGRRLSCVLAMTPSPACSSRWLWPSAWPVRDDRS